MSEKPQDGHSPRGQPPRVEIAGRASGRQPPPHLQKDARGRRKKCLTSPLPTLPSGYASLVAQTQPESEGEEARLPQTRGTEQGRKRQKWIGRGGGGDMEKNPPRHGIPEA